MTQWSRPWGGTIPGDAGPYSDSQWAEMYAVMFGGDQVIGSSTQTDLRVYEYGSGVNMSVDVWPGGALVNGRVYRNTSIENLVIDAADPSLDRIDLVVLRSDASAQIIRLAVKTGTPAASPVAPSVDTTGTPYYEIVLAQVLVEAGSGNIEDSDITDVRPIVLPLIASTPVTTGMLLPFLGSRNRVPAGHLLCDGQAVSMTTYKALLDYLIEAVADQGAGSVISTFGATGAITFTVDVATNKLLAAGHGLNNGDVVMVENSGGALPPELATNTAYYVVQQALNDFKLSLTTGGAEIDLTGTGTGTHSAYNVFKVPDMRGRGFVGLDNMGVSSAGVITATEADTLGKAYGEETHTLTTAEIPAHTHDIKLHWNSGGTLMSGDTNSQSYHQTGTTESAGGGGAHNNVQPSLFGNWIIKT